MRSLRVNLRVPVRYRVIGEESWREGTSENISRTGVLIRATQPAALGAEVDVVLTVPAGIIGGLAGTIICTGAVARRAPDVAGAPGLAVMFRRCRPTAPTVS
jgi:hypothetical protein